MGEQDGGQTAGLRSGSGLSQEEKDALAAEKEFEFIQHLDELLKNALVAMEAMENTARSIKDTGSLKYDQMMDEVVQGVETMVHNVDEQTHKLRVDALQMAREK